MATAGPFYPGTVSTEIGPSGDNDWTNASNIGADDGSEAQITAATYDAGDHSYRLIASNFGFSSVIQSGDTINGITVEIDRRDFAGDAQDQEVRLYDSTATLVGDDKQTATSWPTTSAIATYGGASDTWTAGLDADDIRSSSFGVALIVLANSANTDIGVDFIRVTIDYTPAPITVTPGSASLVLTGYAPTVSAPRLVQPGSSSLVLTGYTPTVAVTANQIVRPGSASLVLTGYTPTISAPRLVQPGSSSLVLTGYIPQLKLGVVPGHGILTLTGFAPTVSVGAGSVTVTPGSASLVLTGYTPTVSTPKLIQPGPASLVLTGFTPTIVTPVIVSIGSASLVLTGFIPTVLVSVADIPGTAELEILDAHAVGYSSGDTPSATMTIEDV